MQRKIFTRLANLRKYVPEMRYPSHLPHYQSKPNTFGNNADWTERGVGYLTEACGKTIVIRASTYGSKQRRYIPLGVRPKQMGPTSKLAYTDCLTNMNAVEKGRKVWIELRN